MGIHTSQNFPLAVALAVSWLSPSLQHGFNPFSIANDKLLGEINLRLTELLQRVLWLNPDYNDRRSNRRFAKNG